MYLLCGLELFYIGLGVMPDDTAHIDFTRSATRGFAKNIDCQAQSPLHI